MALQLYKRVIIPKIIYAAAAWWDGTDIALARFEQERLQRATRITITGAVGTTQSKVPEMFFDLSTAPSIFQ